MHGDLAVFLALDVFGLKFVAWEDAILTSRCKIRGVFMVARK
jgi:hypothetical protein